MLCARLFVCLFGAIRLVPWAVCLFVGACACLCDCVLVRVCQVFVWSCVCLCVRLFGCVHVGVCVCTLFGVVVPWFVLFGVFGLSGCLVCLVCPVSSACLCVCVRCVWFVWFGSGRPKSVWPVGRLAGRLVGWCVVVCLCARVCVRVFITQNSLAIEFLMALLVIYPRNRGSLVARLTSEA